MKSKQENNIAIPKTYNELCEFMSENKQLILTDWNLVSRILETLDELLADAQSMSDLVQNQV